MEVLKERLDFGKLAQLTCLRRLQLRAACGGLTLPSFAFSGGLAALSNLKDLTKLVTLGTQALHVLTYSEVYCNHRIGLS